MDSFTEKMLEKTRARRENLKMYGISGYSLEKKEVSPPRTPLSELSKTSPESVSPKSSEKRKLVSEKENVSADTDYEPTAPKLHSRKARLAALASEINNWEDDLPDSKIIKDLSKDMRPKKADSKTKLASPVKLTSVKVPENVKKDIVNTKEHGCNSAKGFQLDKSVINSLQAQGFVSTKSSAHLVYQFKPNKEVTIQEDITKNDSKSNIVPNAEIHPEIPSQSVKAKAAAFCEQSKETSSKPSLRHLSSKRPEIVKTNDVPKVNDVVKKFEGFAPKLESTKDPAELSVAERRALFEKGLFPSIISKSPVKKIDPIKGPPLSTRSPVKPVGIPHSREDNFDEASSISDTSGQTSLELNKTSYSSENNKSIPVPPPPPFPLASPTSPQQWSPRFKPGCLYPDLEDVESTEGSNTSVEEFSPENSDSLDQSCEASVNQDQNCLSPPQVTNSSPEESYQDDEMDDLLDEALNEISPESSFKAQITPPTVYRTPKVPTPIETSDEGNDYIFVDGEKVPLIHTVSFYRRQKPEDIQYTPVRIVRKRAVELPPPTITVSMTDIHEKLAHYQEEIQAQRTIIAQTSQAVNLCRQSKEFSGSKEQVEAERVLLVANEKLKSLSNEIQRLKYESTLPSGPPSQGTTTISISNIRLTLKQEFLSHVAQNEDEAVHYFICLLKYHQQVIPTVMVSTEEHISQGCLTFPNLINIHDLAEGFEILLEVYALQTAKEKIEHDVKYHIKKEPSKMKLTPMKSILKKPGSSMATPDATLKSSSFGQVGFLKINRSTLKQKAWILDRVPAFSPLEGKVIMTLNSHTEVKVEERGFLTLFDDVSGFGAWHRRWFVLRQGILTYWTYPEDENRKEPLGQIPLVLCRNKEVGCVRRDVCARPHTIMLHIIRAPDKNDRNSLIATCYKDRTEIKYLLSADTKEERILWCDAINCSLNNLRPNCV